MRRRWLVFILVFGLVLGASPAAAIIGVVDPTEEPELLLEAPEAEKVAALQSASFPNILSEVSPDDTTLVTLTLSPSVARFNFLNVVDGTSAGISNVALNYPPMTEVGWRDARTAIYISSNEDNDPVLVSMSRDGGTVMTSTLRLPGFPISLAPNGSRLLVAALSDSEDMSASNKQAMRSPFDLVVRRSPYRQAGPAKFDYAQGDLKISALQVTLAALDLNTGAVVKLVDLPPGSGLASQPRWTVDGSKVTYVRTTIPNVGREGNLLSEAETQDGLGNLPPDKNPFFLGNVVDSFDIGANVLRPAVLKAVDGNGDMYGFSAWSNDGQTLMTKLLRPSKLVGRRYPVYQLGDRSYLRFYNAQMQPTVTLDRPEIEAPYAGFPYWISPDEVIIRTPLGLSYRLYYFNRVTGEFRQISVEDGTYYQVRYTRSGLIIFNMSSFQRPYEIFRIQKDGIAFAGLTYNNAEIAALNQVRVDQVSFTLKSGAKRTGYLVQPAGAAFPPRDVKIVTWQEGGPGGTMTNQWGANVENPYNLLPNFGLVVLMLPLPGREGWGPQFFNDLANGRNFGQIDIDEQVEAVQQMIRRGYTSPGNVGITGCSYGGYFVDQSLTRHPGVYAAGNAQCSLLDLFHEWQFGYTGFVSYLMGRPPTADGAEYLQDSPLQRAVNVRSPLLLFHGTQDFLPIQITANFHDQIEANGTPVALLAFIGEGHGLRSPVSQFTAGQAQVLWFREFLVGGAGIGDGKQRRAVIDRIMKAHQR